MISHDKLSTVINVLSLKHIPVTFKIKPPLKNKVIMILLYYYSLSWFFFTSSSSRSRSKAVNRKLILILYCGIHSSDAFVGYIYCYIIISNWSISFYIDIILYYSILMLIERLNLCYLEHIAIELMWLKKQCKVYCLLALCCLLESNQNRYRWSSIDVYCL